MTDPSDSDKSTSIEVVQCLPSWTSDHLLDAGIKSTVKDSDACRVYLSESLPVINHVKTITLSKDTPLVTWPSFAFQQCALPQQFGTV